MRLARLALAALPALVFAGPAGGPEVFFEQATLTSTDGRPAGPALVSRVWYAGRKMRMEAGGPAAGPALILRLDRGLAYRVDPAEKTVVQIDLARLRARSQMDLSLAGDLMGDVAEGGARTSPLAAPRTIAGYRCRGFRISAGSAVMNVYVTAEIPVGIGAFADFLEWSGATQSLPGLIEEVRRLPGFPLESRSRVTVLGRVQETVSTVTKVKAGPQPPELFEPPPGFRVVVESEP